MVMKSLAKLPTARLRRTVAEWVLRVCLLFALPGMSVSSYAGRAVLHAWGNGIACVRNASRWIVDAALRSPIAGA